MARIPLVNSTDRVMWGLLLARFWSSLKAFSRQGSLVQLVIFVPNITNVSPVIFEFVACRFLKEGVAEGGKNRAEVIVILLTWSCLMNYIDTEWWDRKSKEKNSLHFELIQVDWWRLTIQHLSNLFCTQQQNGLHLKTDQFIIGKIKKNRRIQGIPILILFASSCFVVRYRGIRLITITVAIIKSPANEKLTHTDEHCIPRLFLQKNKTNNYFEMLQFSVHHLTFSEVDELHFFQLFICNKLNSHLAARDTSSISNWCFSTTYCTSNLS